MSQADSMTEIIHIQKQWQPDMSDKCRRYVADPIIGCFRACRCGAIAYREKII